MAGKCDPSRLSDLESKSVKRLDNRPYRRILCGTSSPSCFESLRKFSNQRNEHQCCRGDPVSACHIATGICPLSQLVPINNLTPRNPHPIFLILVYSTVSDFLKSCRSLSGRCRLTRHKGVWRGQEICPSSTSENRREDDITIILCWQMSSGYINACVSYQRII